MNKRCYIGMLVALALTCAGCIKENTENCFSGLRLTFDFSLHTGQPGNLFGANVRVVKVYCFDEQGILRHIQEGAGTVLTNEYEMDVVLESGKYTIIAWAGSRDDFSNCYHEADKAAGGEIEVGQTTLEQFRVIMKCTPAAGVPEDVVPLQDEMDDLYYGAVGTRHPKTSVYTYEQVEVRTGVVVERRVELIRNTNILKVTMNGIENLGLTQAGGFRMWAVTANSEYLSDNAIADQSPSIRYVPYYTSANAVSVSGDIKVLRMDMERHKAEPILLYIEAPDGRRFPSKPIDVVNTLLLARDPDTNEFVYNSQSDFDKIYEHPIELRIGADLNVRIFIGNWEIVYVKPD